MRRLIRYAIGLLVFLLCIFSFVSISKHHSQNVRRSVRDSTKLDSLRRLLAFESEVKRKKVRGRKYFLCGAVPVGPIAAPDTLNFCGESIPLTDTAVKRALQYFINYSVLWAGQKCYLQTINRDVMPLVMPVLKRYGLPPDLIYVAFTESSLQNVSSPSGGGIWQLNANTAIGMGLRIDSFVDERYDVVRCTEAACRYFIYLDKELDSWIKVLPAYNMGDGAFFNIWNNLDRKTASDLLLHALVAQYAFKVLSFKVILSDKQCEGLKPVAGSIHHSIKVKDDINNLAQFALQQKITPAQLKEYNPWLLANRLPNPQHIAYTIRLD